MKRTRRPTPGGRAVDSVTGQRGSTERADCHRVQDVSGSPRIRWRHHEQARSRARRRPRATRSPVRACVGGVPAQSGTRGGVEVVLGEQRGEERPVHLAAHVRHCRAKRCKEIEGKEGWTRIVFCLDPVTLPLEGALEAALQLQKGVRKFGPAPRGPLEREASRLLTQMRGKWCVWRTEWNNTVYTWLGSCVVGYWSLRWCMLSS